MLHPSFERMRAVAAALGSSATTPKGVKSYLKGMRQNARYKQLIRATVCPSSAVLFPNYREIETRRKADPDAKRARDDKRYHKGYLAKLRKWEAVRLSFDASTAAGIAAYLDSRDARQKYLADIARLRTIATGKSCKPLELPKVNRDTHPLATIPIDEKTCRKIGASIIMRGINATLSPCLSASWGDHQDAYTDWSKGRNKPRGIRAVHDNYVRSFGLIVSPQRLECIFHTTQVVVELPTGFIWDRDVNGLRAVCADSRRDDYHPEAAELLRKDAAAYLVTKINAMRQRRQEMAAKIAVEAAAVQGVYVCLADSIRAGNCRQGTLQFAQRHGLNPSRHYSASELLEIANGDSSRVRLAVTAARLRHEKEMIVGYCELSAHRC